MHADSKLADDHPGCDQHGSEKGDHSSTRLAGKLTLVPCLGSSCIVIVADLCHDASHLQDVNALTATGKLADGRDITIDEESERIQREEHREPVSIKIAGRWWFKGVSTFAAAVTVYLQSRCDSLCRAVASSNSIVHIPTQETSEARRDPEGAHGTTCFAGDDTRGSRPRVFFISVPRHLPAGAACAEAQGAFQGQPGCKS